VNYYIKHLLVNKDGGFSDALKYIVAAGDPKLISHPVLSMVSDTLWGGVVRQQFIYGQLWFIFSLFVFMFSQCVLPKFLDHEGHDDKALRVVILLGRAVNYLFAMCRLLWFHFRMSIIEIRRKHTTYAGCGIWVPQYLSDPHNVGTLLLTVLLVLMCSHEPALWCVGIDEVFSGSCYPEFVFRYSVFSMWTMILFWLLLMNLAVFSTSLSAFTLVGAHVLSEVWRFAGAMILLLLAFGSGVSALNPKHPIFADLPSSILAMFSIVIGLFEVEEEYEKLREEPALLAAILGFMSVCVVLLLNLLIAQLNSAYEFIFQDMVGYARLHRASLIVKSLGSCHHNKWQQFVEGLHLEQKLELNEGDVGPAAGVQVYEPANAISGVDDLDNIRRFGGDTDLMRPWPKEDTGGRQTDDRIESLEALIKKVYKKLVKEKDSKKGAHSDSNGGPGGSTEQSSSNHSEAADDE